MRIIYLFFVIMLIHSCGHPDIDSVPKFEDVKLSKEEAIDLCNISNTDKIEIDKCLNEIDYN